MSKNKQIRVLYIEDNPGHARLLVKRLEKGGGDYIVEWVDDAMEGLKKASNKDGHFDIVLVDYNLKGKSGVEIIRRLKTYENAPPTVMITASGNEEVAVKALQSGASNYLIKDINFNYLDLLPIIICETISKRQMEEDKKRAENELQQTNALLKAEQEAINSGILVINLSGKVVRYNKRFLELWDIPENLANEGEEEDKLLSYVSKSLNNWDDFIKLVEYLYKHPKEERIGDIIELKSGRILSRNTRPVLLESGEIIGRLWDFDDITKMKKAEEEIRKLSTAVEQSPNMVIIIDTEGNIEYVNPKFTKVTGYTPEEVIGKKPHILESESEPKEHYAQLWNSLTSGREWCGEFHDRKKNGETYWSLISISPLKDSDGKIIHYVSMQEDISERKRQEELIQHMAYHDSLTGLPNRRTFFDRLSVEITEAKRYKQKFAVIFIDLDNFKEVNDTLGHEIGDKVLQTVTRKMSRHLRESDTLARTGGDEFILLIPKIKKTEDAQTVAEKFLETFQKPQMIDGHEIPIGLSMGVSFYPENGKEPDILIKKADEAMYRAKQSGRNNFKISLY